MGKIDLTAFGYAPGDYHCKCLTCKEDFHGDKRASVCKSCAETSSKEQLEDTSSFPIQCDEQERPVIGSSWRHRNGNIYEVTGYTNLHSENTDRYPIMIIYRGNNGLVWSRQLSDWYRSFSPVEMPQTGGEND